MNPQIARTYLPLYSKELDENFKGEMDCAGCPQCGVHLAQKSELRAHQISHEPQLRTKIRAELTSNLSSTSASDKNPS